MKNSEIHKGLREKEIRDFFSNSLLKIYIELGQIKKQDINYDDTPYDLAIKTLEEEILYSQALLKPYKNLRAVLTLIQSKNWQEFDVSEDTIDDSTNGIMMSFIGNKKEYDNLINKINNNDGIKQRKTKRA
jgi:hypothetical protein